MRFTTIVQSKGLEDDINAGLADWDDLEKFLGFTVPDKEHRKPSRLLLALKEAKIDSAKADLLCKLVEELAGLPPK